MKTLRICPRKLFSAFCVMVLSFALAAGASLQAAEPNPYARADDTLITISGTVDSVEPNSFMLDYGDGLVRVDMDDGDRDADAYKLLKGDKVTVSGIVDDDFFETTTIEAGSVYVENLDTTFFASAVDEEDYEFFDPSATPPIVVSQTVVRGTVSKVEGDEFLVNTGLRLIRVDTESMTYNPLDDEGYLKISKGDRVKVIGRMDTGLFEGRELRADVVVKLYKS